MTRLAVTAQTIRRIHAALDRAYGPLGDMPLDDPVDSLIETILTQNTSGQNSTRAFRSLKQAFPRWTKALRARPAEIEERIRCGGLAKTKSVRIRNVLAAIKEREGRISLERLRDMPTRQALDYLLRLDGVGVKTACCVLLFALGRPVMPVDTHVYRIARRLRWLRPSVPIEKAGECLESIIPPGLVLPLHLHLIAHGRRICRARNPACHRCPIRAHCPEGRKRHRSP